MTEFVSQILDAVSVGSVLTSALLGILIGSFYGYYLSPHGPPLYPWSLLVVGISFVFVFGVFGWLTGAPFEPAFQVGRAILWTVTVSAIPIGRYGRHLLSARQISRRLRYAPETRNQREDREMGDRRRVMEQEHLDES